MSCETQLPGTQTGKETRQRKCRSPCRIASLYVQRLWSVTPWLTHRHRERDSEREMQTDSFWPAILLAQPAALRRVEQKNR